MKTWLIALFVLIFGTTSKAQDFPWQKELQKKSSSTYARLKYYWPDSLLASTLIHLSGTLSEKRCFVYGLSNVEGGAIKAVKKNGPGERDDVFGLLQITQSRVDDFYQHHPEEKVICTAKDLSDPTKSDYITKVIPLLILDDAVAHYDGMDNYEAISKQWKIGGNQWQTKATDYYTKVSYSAKAMYYLQEQGLAAIFNRPNKE